MAKTRVRTRVADRLGAGLDTSRESAIVRTSTRRHPEIPSELVNRGVSCVSALSQQSRHVHPAHERPDVGWLHIWLHEAKQEALSLTGKGL